jgi:steroid delta-isomerase-like uncharacterized protein
MKWKTEENTMPDGENVAVIQRWFHAVNAHDPDLFPELLDEGFAWEAGTTSRLGLQAAMASWRTLFVAFPDLRLEPEQVLTQGDYVVARWRMTGIHRGDLAFTGSEGPLRPLAATNRRIDLTGCSIHELRNGKIIRSWVYRDMATLLRQLGVLTSEATWP